MRTRRPHRARQSPLTKIGRVQTRTKQLIVCFLFFFFALLADLSKDRASLPLVRSGTVVRTINGRMISGDRLTIEAILQALLTTRTSVALTIGAPTARARTSVFRAQRRTHRAHRAPARRASRSMILRIRKRTQRLLQQLFLILLKFLLLLRLSLLPLKRLNPQVLLHLQRYLR